jgi:hypothetical protein
VRAPSHALPQRNHPTNASLDEAALAIAAQDVMVVNPDRRAHQRREAAGSATRRRGRLERFAGVAVGCQADRTTVASRSSGSSARAGPAVQRSEP